MIARHVIILSRNRLHHWIPRGQFTPFSHENKCSTDLRFLSVLEFFPYLRDFYFFELNFRHWSLKISEMWSHKEFSSTNSESVLIRYRGQINDSSGRVRFADTLSRVQKWRGLWYESGRSQVLKVDGLKNESWLFLNSKTDGLKEWKWTEG